MLGLSISTLAVTVGIVSRMMSIMLYVFVDSRGSRFWTITVFLEIIVVGCNLLHQIVL